MDWAELTGENRFYQWIQSIKREKAQSKIDDRLLQLMTIAPIPSDWVDKYEGLDGDIFELKITFQNVQYRPFWCYGPGRGQLTFLHGAIEKNWKIPRGDLRTTEDRYRKLRQDERHAVDHRFLD